MQNAPLRPFSHLGTQIETQEGSLLHFHGTTYFKKPTGRPTDGRLYIDFEEINDENNCLEMLMFSSSSRLALFEPLSTINWV